MLGVLPALGVVAVQPVDDRPGEWRLWGDHQGATWRACANRERLVCNWLVLSGDHPYCASCSLTRTQPAVGDPAGGNELVVAEAAKRRLLYQLAGLGLPIVGRDQDPREGLAFEFLSSAGGEPVTTGHQDGIIIMDLAESNDVHREGMRHAMGEPYRTVLGHLRHEIGHYYWMLWLGTAGRLGADPCQRVRDHPSVGGLGRDVRPLPAHPGHAADRCGLRVGGDGPSGGRGHADGRDVGLDPR